MRVLVVGIPGEQRVLALCAALTEVGLDPLLLPWSLALHEPEQVRQALRPGDLLRVDSPAADEPTSRALRRLGGDPGDPLPAGAWRPGRAWATGLDLAMRNLPDGTHPAATTALMTDKHACRDHLAAHGLPVPPGALAPEHPDAARAWMHERRLAQVFVKPRWGSSGAGVLAWRRHGAREQLTTTLRLHDGQLVQHKRLHRTTDPGEIDRLLGPVLRDGAVIERWIPKLGVGEHTLDLRVVVVDGQPALKVARLARGPITNLHLNAHRADPADLLPPKLLHELDQLCARAAATFPGHRAFGLDVLVDTTHRLWICECNAWGDDVRRVQQRGATTWQLQARALAGLA